MSKWVLVECVSQYRMRYLVEAPDDHPEYALDTVTAQQAKEFSQLWLGETIVSHRIVTEEEALDLSDEDNSYLKNWSDEQKRTNLFTSMEEQGYDIVEHTEEYYDTERNR